MHTISIPPAPFDAVDFLLSQETSNSRTLVHDSGTVVEFVFAKRRTTV